jgi:hypothetical protein
LGSVTSWRKVVLAMKLNWVRRSETHLCGSPRKGLQKSSLAMRWSWKGRERRIHE